MDEVFGILFALAAGAAILFGPWILLLRSHNKRVRQREEDQTRFGELTKRVFLIEEVLRRGAATSPDAQYERPGTVAPPISTPPIAVSTPSRVERPVVSAVPLEPVTESPTVELPIPASVGAADSTLDREMFASVASARTASQRFKSTLDLEETLGTNWLNKLGVGILVLGIAFFLAYQLKNVGPSGKVLVGYVVSAVMLGLGIWLERSSRYRILARAGVGGGWALAFFTTYAMYHVPAAHVIDSQLVDLVLMLAVAGVMVWHTLHYCSQVVTGLVFLLAFLTVSISHSNVYSLGAGGILAAGLVLIVVRMQWFELEIFGILASYLNHYLWLRPIIEPMQGRRHSFPEFIASAGILLLYWAIFRASYVLRRPASLRQEHISTAAALLNTTLLLGLFKYQSTHPEWAFWALLAIGSVETALGRLPITRRRRTAEIVLTTLGMALLIAAYPFRYSGTQTQLSVVWLLEAEALLLIGVWTREIVFRRLGALVSLLVAGQMLSINAARVAGARMDGADITARWPLAILFAIAACVFYANAHWVLRRWSQLFAHEFDRRLMKDLSFVGAVMAATAAWLAFPEAWTAVAWSALGLGLILLGRRVAAPELRYQANFLAIASILRALSINLEITSTYHGLSQRAITISLVAVVLYVTSRWSAVDGEAAVADTRIERGLLWFLHEGVYTWSGSLLVGLLAWYELRAVGVAVAWAVGGLLLLEFGITRKSLSLRLQAYAALLAAFLRVFFVNLNAAGTPGEVSPRFYTIVPLAAAFCYAYWRLHQQPQHLTRLETKFRAAEVCCWMGTITLAALMRFELDADWVAAGWAALAFTLTAIAWRTRKQTFLHQGLLLVVAVVFRTVLHNFYERSYFPAPSWQTRWITVGTTLAFLLFAQPFLFNLRDKKGESEGEVPNLLFRFLQAAVRRPEQVFFFAMLGLLTALLAVEMRHGMVTLSWGVEAMAVFVFALWVGERSFRLAGLGLLLMSAAKILLMDVWRLNPSDRYLTLIVLGAVLLAVSYLYTRYREAIRQYL